MLQVTRYENIHREVGSAGACRIVWPIVSLLTVFAIRFSRIVLQTLSQCGRNVPVSAMRIDLDDLFFGMQSRQFSHQGTCTSIQLAVQAADDLVTEQGIWADDAEGLAELASSSTEDVLRKLDLEFTRLRGQYGEAAADRWLKKTRKAFEKERDTLLRRIKQLPNVHPEPLRDISARLSGALQAKNWIQRLLRLATKDWLPGWSLTERQQSELKKGFRELNALAQEQHQRQILKAQLVVLHNLLGISPGKAAALNRFSDQLAASAKVIREVDEVLAKHQLAAESTKLPASDLLVVESLDTVINPQSQRTVYDLFLSLAAELGITAERLAETIRRHGFRKAKKCIHVADWSEHSPADLASVTLKLVSGQLGTGDLNRPLQVESPQLPVDRIAALTLASPELAGVVEPLLKVLVNRSQPYLDRLPISDAAGPVRAYIYSHPSQQSHWSELLKTLVRLTDAEDFTAYATYNPWILELHQEYLGVPAGALTGYWKWKSNANAAQRKGLIPALFDGSADVERRLLPERENDREDSRALFAAALRAKVVFEIQPGSKRFGLSKGDPRLQPLFARSVFEARSCSPEYFQRLVKSRRFNDFCQRVFTARSDIRQQLESLARETDADFVAHELTRLGIITRSGDDCRISCPLDRRTPDVVEGLFDEKFGPMDGLTEDDFVSTLGRNDLLYTVLFCQVLDAYEQGWLSANEVPKSVLTRSRELT